MPRTPAFPEPAPSATSTAPADLAAESIAQLMQPVVAAMPPDATVAETVERIREWVKTSFVTYVYVREDDTGRLAGLVAMRELLLADRGERLSDIMLADPFALRPDMSLLEAMRLVVKRHYPCYPVCDAAGVLVGLVWGHKLFEAEAIEISAQSGKMVGVAKEERFETPLRRSFLSRHPWLQVNMLTNFMAAAVVGSFASTINKYVALAVFLPVMASQAANTGCQSLAVALRGLTLGDIAVDKAGALLSRETWLGLLNGFLTGITAAIGMFAYATIVKESAVLALTTATLLATTGCCVVAGQIGAVMPLVLKRVGADPATASSILVTTVTDMVSMGLFLWIATILLG